MSKPIGKSGQHSSFAKPKNAKGTLKRIGKYLLKSKYIIALALVLLAVSTGCTLLGAYLLKPIINDYILPANYGGLAVALLGLAGIYGLGAVAQYFQNRVMIGVAQKTVNVIRRDLFGKMQDIPIRFFDQNTHGELMSRYTNDIDAVQNMLEQTVIQLIAGVITFLGTLFLMLALSVWLTMTTMVVLVIMIALTTFISKRSSTHFKAQQQALGKVNGFVEEDIEGLKVVKVFNHEPLMNETFDELAEQLCKASTKAQFYSGIVMPIMGNLNNANYALTAMLGGLLCVMGLFDIGSLASYLGLSRQFGMPIQQITMQVNNVLSAIAGAERVFAVMDQPKEEDAGRVVLTKAQHTEQGLQCVNSNAQTHCWAWKQPDGQLTQLKGDVRLRGVTFGYDQEMMVLKDLTLYAKPGQKIAFVGSTGAGKTTITNLINRFYNIQAGTITFDGIDIKEILLDDLRRSLGMVLQDTHLFSATVADNIRYGKPDATMQEVEQAAKLACAHSFIVRLAQGYDTDLSGDGTSLSQGQRQLLSIARTALLDPPVLILDEATSSVDTRTEWLIQQGMDALMKGRTTFVIAHRLSTVRNADAIMVLEHGEIIERGDHADLLAQKGKYYQLYTGQYELE